MEFQPQDLPNVSGENPVLEDSNFRRLKKVKTENS